VAGAILGLALLAGAGVVRAQDAAAPALPAGIQVRLDPASTPAEYGQSIRIMLLLTALSLAPSFIVMMTSFTRILIVLGIIRQAIGLQNVPPGQVVAGMALFLSIFTMAPVWQKINEDALKPYAAEEITQEEAWTRGFAPIKAFMLNQVGDSELNLFVEISGIPTPASREDVPTHVLIPAFLTSEMKVAMQMAFLIYLPFLVIDLVIASSLMSLGMMMLPPMMVALPIKILLFVLADGWVLCMRGLVTSFRL
jgi:flagellar biosynthetic protein FliP